MSNEWVEKPRPHLPFVPCRVLPRNVVQQERQKLQPDGSIRDYLKPRITTDSSDGGESGSPNEGCDRPETAVRFPTVRHLGQASAICQAAGADDGLSAHIYIFDLSSAYRYLPMQRADWWMHCFLWMRPNGSWGVAIDTRLAFGGGYSPQRFERLATLAVSLASACGYSIGPYI